MAISKVTSGGIADGTLSVEDIKDDAVTAAKLANSINTDIATGVTGNTTANAALPKAGGAMTGAITTNSTFDGVDIATRDGVLTSTTATAAAALPKAGGTMTGTTAHGDGVASTFGDSADLTISHAGGSTYLTNTTGSLILRTDSLRVLNTANSEQILHGDADGAVTLYHNNIAKIATSANGATVTGTLSSAASAALHLQQNLNTTKNLYFSDTTLSTYDSQTGTVDLGRAVARWKDLYLEGGAYIGGTGAANKLGDYETGTWTAGFTGGTISVNNSTGHYTKVGRKVFFQYYTSSMAISSAGNSARITGLPFTSSNTADTYGLFNYQHGNAVDGGCRGGFIGKNDTQLVFTDTDSTDQPIYVNGSPRYIMVAGSYFVD